MKKISCIIIGAGGRGGGTYAPHIAQRDDMEIVGVAEPDVKRRAEFQKKYGVKDSMCFESYEQVFENKKSADAVLICTMDSMHTKPALMAIEQNYHILIEKPIAQTKEEVQLLERKIRNYDKAFVTGFVLRYTPFFTTIKKYIESGKLGRVMSVQHNENEGYWHHAHNYVRGQWNNSKKSAPFIIAKSSHDIDLLVYLMDSECKRISSYGGNTYYTRACMPEGAPARCSLGCPHSDKCKYCASKMYLETECRKYMDYFGLKTDEEILDFLKTSDYGKCIYQCDNDVADHQVASMEFENGATAVFTVSAFTAYGSRTIKVMGSDAEIGGCLETGDLLYREFGKKESEKIIIPESDLKHGGGDKNIIDYFASAIHEGKKADMSEFYSHMLCFAAEEARITEKSLNVREFINK